MAEKTIMEKKLLYMEFINRENDFQHFYYDEEMLQYELLRVGNPQAVEEGSRLFCSDMNGHLSEDPLRHYQYLFVAAITLATRFAIQGGMNAEKAYNASDLYINKADACKTPEEVKALHREMFAFFTRQVAEVKKEKVFSQPVVRCMDYIYHHLYETIRVADLAAYVGLNSNYLSALFKKEAGMAISDYVTARRIEAAENMLKYSDYSYADIAAYLAFSSQSHFIRVFKAKTGYTPKEYRKLFFRVSFMPGQEEPDDAAKKDTGSPEGN